MSVRADGAVVRLEGDCHVEDAETLAALLAAPGATVSVDGCSRIHAAVLQALIALKPRIEGRFADEALERRLGPLLRGGPA